MAIVGAMLGGAAAIDLAEHDIPNRLVLSVAAACAALTIANGLNTPTMIELAVIALLLATGLAVPSVVGMSDSRLILVVVVGLDQSAPHALLLALVLAAPATVVTVISRGRDLLINSLPLDPYPALESVLALI